MCVCVCVCGDAVYESNTIAQSRVTWTRVRRAGFAKMNTMAAKKRSASVAAEGASTSDSTHKRARQNQQKQKFISVRNGHGDVVNEPMYRRDARGGLVLDEMYKNFRPNLTPAQVIAMGSFGGCYFHPRGGKPGILSPKKGVAVSHLEFPVTVRGHHESARA